MTDKKSVLGRGLSALLKNPETDITSNEPISDSKVAGSVNEIAITQIEIKMKDIIKFHFLKIYIKLGIDTFKSIKEKKQTD